MTKISHTNSRTNKRKAACSVTVSNSIKKKPAGNSKALSPTHSHRTPTQLHASTYVYHKS